MPFKTHPNLEEPIDEQIVWRYMDFPKLYNLVTKRALFFPSINLVRNTDPWEGYPSKRNFEPTALVESHENEKVEMVSLEKIFGSELDAFNKKRKESLRQLGNGIFINSWHMNDDESDSQWRIYGNSEYALAVVTSVQKLKKAIVDSRIVYGTKVRYFRPEDDFTPEGQALLTASHKRTAFLHEKEFRLIFLELSKNKSTERPDGIYVEVDVNSVIGRVVLSPRSPKWFNHDVQSFLKSNDIDVKVIRSNLYDDYS